MKSAKELFNSVEKLYHYTSFEKGLCIIKSNTLRFGKLKDMNDINELYRPLFCINDSDEDEENVQHLIDQLQQISLTIDDKKKRMGFDIPSMWGHYADKGNGVCLVFDKNILVKSFPEYVVCKGEISYTNDYVPSIIKYGELRPFTTDELEELFFKKTKDWEPEQEYRILAENKTDESRLELPLGDSLIAVIMHNAPDIKKTESVFSSQHYQELSKIIDRDSIFGYGSLIDQRGLSNWRGDSIWDSAGLDKCKIDIEK